tara:strand:- start:21 stop:200 length:180 start_codon:yes stop_codon:yes gene_type:complete
MNFAFLFLILGVALVSVGFTNSLAPKCNQDVQVKIVPRIVYDEILHNQELVDAVYTDML